MIAVVDSGVGNLRSVEKALAAVGAKVCLTADSQIILSAQKVVLPGVGAFADTMGGLRDRGLVGAIETVFRRQTPLLGICVGMQVMFETGEEMGNHDGLGFLPGRVRRFDEVVDKVPQTGWNQLLPLRHSPLLAGIEPESYAYFNHSYYCDPVDSRDVLVESTFGTGENGGVYASAVQRGTLYGVQFHPEKSQQVGLTLLRNFVDRCQGDQ